MSPLPPAPPTTREAARSLLLSHRMVAVLRTATAAEALTAGRAVLDGGARMVEVTYTVPGALEVLAELRAAAPPGAMIGIGTVLGRDDLERAIAAGAAFFISPDVDPDLIRAAAAAGVFHVPGAMTPSEVTAALRAGAEVVKLFPIGSLGGAVHVRAIRGPLPAVPFLVTGGPDLDTVGDYFAAGAAAVGIGPTLVVPEWLRTGQIDRIREHTAAYLRKIEKIPIRPGPLR